MPTCDKQLIETQQSVRVRFDSNALPNNDPKAKFNYLEMQRFIRRKDSQGLIIGIDFRILVGIALPATETPSTESERQRLKPFLDYWRRYQLYNPIPEIDEELVERALSEADLRTRIAASDFLYTCGGEKLRSLFVTIAHGKKIPELDVDTQPSVPDSNELVTL